MSVAELQSESLAELVVQTEHVVISGLLVPCPMVYPTNTYTSQATAICVDRFEVTISRQHRHTQPRITREGIANFVDGTESGGKARVDSFQESRI
jgi:hypothetical protein